MKIAEDRIEVLYLFGSVRQRLNPAILRRILRCVPYMAADPVTKLETNVCNNHQLDSFPDMAQFLMRKRWSYWASKLNLLSVLGSFSVFLFFLVQIQLFQIIKHLRKKGMKRTSQKPEHIE